MKSYLRFWTRLLTHCFKGDKVYFSWLGILATIVLGGLWAYSHQISQGLTVTNMSDQVVWGVYVGNFTFLVGVAAAAVSLVVPGHIYKIQEIKKVSIFGELLAVAALGMCLLFILVDMGRPERFWEMIPFIGRLNFPASILAWDVIALLGYLIINLYIPCYLLYTIYRGRGPNERLYSALIYLSIGWAISIHTVTAFLYSGLAGRPYWNSALLAPRFLVSAFSSGPAFLIIIFILINKFYKDFTVPPVVLRLLRKVVRAFLVLNMFLLGCEAFREFYTDSAHISSARYLFLGLHGFHMLLPFIWSAIFFQLIAIIILYTNKLYSRTGFLLFACVLTIVGVWFEKGVGLLIPGFIPSPLGLISEYLPSSYETLICFGIWALGAMGFTVMTKVTLAVLTGKIQEVSEE